MLGSVHRAACLPPAPSLLAAAARSAALQVQVGLGGAQEGPHVHAGDEGGQLLFALHLTPKALPPPGSCCAGLTEAPCSLPTSLLL